MENSIPTNRLYPAFAVACYRFGLSPVASAILFKQFAENLDLDADDIASHADQDFLDQLAGEVKKNERN